MFGFKQVVEEKKPFVCQDQFTKHVWGKWSEPFTVRHDIAINKWAAHGGAVITSMQPKYIDAQDRACTTCNEFERRHLSSITVLEIPS